MKHNLRLVFWEVVLLIASVLVFRGGWLLLDRLDWLNHPVGLWASLAFGMIVATVALVGVNRASSK